MKKIGIIGSGKIVSWFLKDLKVLNRSDWKVTGLYARNKVTANETIQKFGIDTFYETYEEFLKQDFDLVYIGTPDATHLQFSKDLLNNGFNVYCEKPITFTKKDAEEVYALAKQKNKLFFDGIKTGFSPAYKKMKEEIAKGVIGDLILVHTTHTKVSTSLKKPNPGPELDIQGFQMGGGVYSAFVALDLGGKVIGYDHRSNPYPNNKAISTSAILTRHESGVISTIVGSDYTTDNLTAVIQGSKGYITLGGNLDKYNESYKKDSCHMAHTIEIRDLKNDLISKFDDPFISEGEGLRFTAEHVLDLINEGKTESDIVTPELSIAVIDLLEKTNTLR